MFYSELSSIIDKIKYKDVQLTYRYLVPLHTTGHNYIRIYATMPVLDRDTQERTVIANAIDISEAMGKALTKAALIKLVYDLIVRIELHEAAECFYYDGVRIYDPHKTP